MVVYRLSSICAPRGSTVEMSVFYRSYDEDHRRSSVSTSWFRTERGLQGRRRSPGLKNVLQSDGRVQIFSSSRGNVNLSISNLAENDSAEYQFTFHAGSSVWTSVLPGTGVTVTGNPDPAAAQVPPLLHPQQPALICSSAGSAAHSV